MAEPAPLVSGAVSAAKSFPELLLAVEGIEGWMSDGQARLLHERAAELGAGAQIVEIGSFRGRSMIVLASSAADGVAVTAIDPHLGSDRGPQEIAADHERGDDDYSIFHANLRAAGVAERVTHVRKRSDEALGDVDGEIDLLYIDGAHRFAPARADIVEWGDRVSGGGTMLVHDSFSSIGVTLALLTTTFVSGRWRYVGRSRSMAEFQRVNLSPGERVVDALRQALQLPWFLRNVLIKVLILARLRPLTRLLGHPATDEWPY